MNSPAEEAAQIVESLPPEKAQALVEFARYLAETADREAWDERFGNPRYASKLDEMAGEALDEWRAGKTQPIDPDQM